ncbi:hypothetical protein QWT87_13510 [Chryseobacterium sp. APV1]|uniref:DUF4595 domain-containing protein n=1 Tax=Chryseobacterium urinae TaxID=3058400 RepID=A0ABT8U4C8_9FLAO|nr:hypothetical protein [Chryseobacterium sp. APV1]MDO3425912.1 hypothetical protein [Chryseobacterium sp. APV1]
MKKILLLFLYQIIFSCNGQESKITKTTYSQKLEYGLKGAVKEVTQYTCAVKDDKIPTNKYDNIGKSTMTFDNQGNVIEINRSWNFGTLETSSKFKQEYSGTGKNITFKEISNTHGNIEELNHKFVWSDDYNYSIIPEKTDPSVNTVTLDKNYRLLKYVTKKGDKIEYVDDIETIYKDNKIHEIKTKTTEYIDGKMIVDYKIQVMQNFDTHGNPTVIYTYRDINKQKIAGVLFKDYTYY